MLSKNWPLWPAKIGLMILSALLPALVYAATPLELQYAISEKEKALQAVTNQIRDTQKQLIDTEARGKTLKAELGRIDYSINQVNLSIKSSEITIDKLELEIAALQYDIADTEAKSTIKKSGIKNLLRSLQERDDESLLLALLKTRTLGETLGEVEAISDLNGGLSSEVVELTNIKNDLSAKLDARSKKRQALVDENRTLKLRKSLAEDQRVARSNLLAQTKNMEKAYQSQLEKLKNQQESIFDEITKIEDEMRAKFDTSLLPGKRPGVFEWPVKLVKDGGTGRITQHEGEISRLYRGKPHNGLDIGTPQGTPVYAAEDGIVIRVDNNDRSSWAKYQYGKYVMLQHKNNLSTLYAHLSVNTIVAEGAYVKRGDLIGYSGNTGYSTGAHLHFGVYWSSSVLFKYISPAAGVVPIGVVVNPEDYL